MLLCEFDSDFHMNCVLFGEGSTPEENPKQNTIQLFPLQDSTSQHTTRKKGVALFLPF